MPTAIGGTQTLTVTTAEYRTSYFGAGWSAWGRIPGSGIFLPYIITTPIDDPKCPRGKTVKERPGTRKKLPTATVTIPPTTMPPFSLGGISAEVRISGTTVLEQYVYEYDCI